MFAPPASPDEPGAAALARVAPVGEWAQDCALPPGCPPEDLDPARCLEDPVPFVPTWVDGEVVAITVDPALLPPLADGEWWTAWGDGISCERVAVTFAVGDAVAP